MRSVCNWGPLIAIGIIVVVSVSSTYSALQLWSLPESVVWYFRGTQFWMMYLWLIPIFWNFFQAMRGPGYVPFGWKPEDPSDEQYLQFCRVCQGFKPPRSHHCNQCKRCIMKMDHHCPWINSCVGHGNQISFMQFLLFVPFGCIHGVIVNINFLYRLLVDYHFLFHPPYLSISTSWIIFTVTGISLGIGTALGVFILLLAQLKGVITNCTQIEEWILEKAKHRRRVKKLPAFIFPYNLGWYKNFCQVVNLSWRAVGDGIVWPVKEGCEKYSFTIEQLEQKKLKKERSVSCSIKKDYSGGRCPIFDFGFMTAFCLPCCAERRVKVRKGDLVVVTRWERKWVYGDKHGDDGKIEKGWFPRACVQPITVRMAPPDHPNDSQLSDTQASTHSDSQYSQLSDTDQETINDQNDKNNDEPPPSPLSVSVRTRSKTGAERVPSSPKIKKDLSREITPVVENSSLSKEMICTRAQKLAKSAEIEENKVASSTESIKGSPLSGAQDTKDVVVSSSIASSVGARRRGKKACRANEDRK